MIAGWMQPDNSPGVFDAINALLNVLIEPWHVVSRLLHRLLKIHVMFEA